MATKILTAEKLAEYIAYYCDRIRRKRRWSPAEKAAAITDAESTVRNLLTKMGYQLPPKARK